MISEKCLNVLKSFTKLNSSFKLDRNKMVVSTDDGSILATYKVQIDDGLELFEKYPLNNINQFIDDIEDMSSYSIEIKPDNSLLVKGITKNGLDVKIKRLPAIIDETIDTKIERIETLFQNIFQEEIEFTLDKMMFEHIMKRAKKIDNADPIMTIFEDDNIYYIKLHNKMIKDYSQEIKLNRVSVINNTINRDNNVMLSILALARLPKDDQGYRVIIKSKTVERQDGTSNTIFLVNFKPISIENLDFYMSTTI